MYREGNKLLHVLRGIPNAAEIISGLDVFKRAGVYVPEEIQRESSNKTMDIDKVIAQLKALQKSPDAKTEAPSSSVIPAVHINYTSDCDLATTECPEATLAACAGHARQANVLYGKKPDLGLSESLDILDESKCEVTSRLFLNHLITAVVEESEGQMAVEVPVLAKADERKKWSGGKIDYIYNLQRNGMPVVAVEAKHSGTFSPDAVAQIITKMLVMFLSRSMSHLYGVLTDGRRFSFFSILNGAFHLYVKVGNLRVFTINNECDLAEITGILLYVLKKHRIPSGRTTMSIHTDDEPSGGNAVDIVRVYPLGSDFQRFVKSWEASATTKDEKDQKEQDKIEKEAAEYFKSVLDGDVEEETEDEEEDIAACFLRAFWKGITDPADHEKDTK